MLSGIIAGAVGALVVSKVMWRVRRGRCGGGGCGGGGYGFRRGGWGRHARFGHHGGFMRGGGGRRRLEWLLRDLELNPRQREEVEAVIHEVRDKLGGLELGNIRGNLGSVVEAFGDESFDRGKLDAVAAQKGEAFQQAKKAVLDGLERVHDILIPEQRARLRQLLSRLTGARHVEHDDGDEADL
jgi:Spy/CpxP family protein refolding chaperone